MKDFVPKGTGNSRFLKSISTFLTQYPTYADFANALINGTLPVDFNGINPSGITQAGTPISKATLLDDSTAQAIGLTGSNPTVNDALLALANRVPVYICGDVGTTATMTRNGTTLTGTVEDTGFALLYPYEYGVWTVTGTALGSSYSKSFNLTVQGSRYCYPFEIGSSLETTSWSDISLISRLGYAQNFFSVGDTKTLTVNDITYTAVIIGFDHDNVNNATTYKRSKAGITFQLVDCLNTTYRMEETGINTNGWNGCNMRLTHLRTTIWGQLQTSLKNVIVTVNKLASAGDQSTTIVTSADTLFLLSEIEVFGARTYSVNGEGTQYAWYTAGNSKIKKVNGSANYWWLRSPVYNSSTNFCTVSGGGGAYTNTASIASGVSFGFCV